MSEQLEELAHLGEIYESGGVKYLRTPNSDTGIRADRLKAFSDVVEKVTSLQGIWYEVKLAALEQPFHVHHNWMTLHGPLLEGDKVEGVLDVGENPPRAWYLRKIVKQTESAV